MDIEELDELDRKLIVILSKKLCSAQKIYNQKEKLFRGHSEPTSPRQIGYRIKKLENERIITKVARFNYEEVGLGAGFLFIKTVNEEAFRNVKRYLTSNKHVYKLYVGSGDFDIVAVLYIKDFSVVSKFLASIREIPGIEKKAFMTLETGEIEADLIEERLSVIGK